MSQQSTHQWKRNDIEISIYDIVYKWNFSIAQTTDEHALFHALYRTSIKGRRELTELLLDPNKTEGNISDTYDSRTAEIFSVILNSLGFDVEFTDSDSELREWDNEKYVTRKIGDTSFLGSTYTANMLERIDSIAKGYLEDKSIMDKGELVDLVRDKLMAGEYLMGVDTSDPNEVEALLGLYFDLKENEKKIKEAEKEEVTT